MNRQSPTSLLLATDRLASPLLEAGAASPTARAAYTPYGYRPGGAKGMQSRTGFTGQLRESEIGWYMLGNGHRAYNPILMRFHSPDQLSPFGAGGLNSYAYCSGDPINFKDPSGRFISTGLAVVGIGVALANAALYLKRTGINLFNKWTQRRAPNAETGYLAATTLTNAGAAGAAISTLAGASEAAVNTWTGGAVASGAAAFIFDGMAESNPPRVQQISRTYDGQDWMSRNSSPGTQRSSLTSYSGPGSNYDSLAERGELNYSPSGSSDAGSEVGHDERFAEFVMDVETDIAVKLRRVRQTEDAKMRTPTAFDFSRHFK